MHSMLKLVYYATKRLGHAWSRARTGPNHHHSDLKNGEGANMPKLHHGIEQRPAPAVSSSSISGMPQPAKQNWSVSSSAFSSQLSSLPVASIKVRIFAYASAYSKQIGLMQRMIEPGNTTEHTNLLSTSFNCLMSAVVCWVSASTWTIRKAGTWAQSKTASSPSKESDFNVVMNLSCQKSYPKNTLELRTLQYIYMYMSMRSSALDRTMAAVWFWKKIRGTVCSSAHHCKSIKCWFRYRVLLVHISFFALSNIIIGSRKSWLFGVALCTYIIIYIVQMRACLVLYWTQRYDTVYDTCHKSSASHCIVQILSRLRGWWSKVHPHHSVQNRLRSALRNPINLHKSQESHGERRGFWFRDDFGTLLHGMGFISS